MKTRTRRGQTMVLFALTLLVLALMVLITVSMGARTKDRMELQTAADTMAWNGAVATARTFNAISVMNRVQVAHVVSTLGTISLISWATLYWKHTSNASKLFTAMAVPYAIDVIFQCLPPPKPKCPFCQRGLAQTIAAAVLAGGHASRTKSRLQGDTKLFTEETAPRWNAAKQIHASQVELLDRLRTYMGPTGPAAALTASMNVRAPEELVYPDASGILSSRELDDALTDYPYPVAGAEPLHVGHMVMGSRGNKFLYRRMEDGDWGDTFPGDSIAMRAKTTFVGGGISIDRGRGQGYLDRNWTPNPTGEPFGPLAHDGQGSRTKTWFVPAYSKFKNWVKCNSPLPAFFIAEAIGLSGKGVGIGGAAVSADQHLSIGHNVQHAFRTFPPFVDFNAASLSDIDNLHGQPRVVSSIAREPKSAEIFEPTIEMNINGGGTRLTLGTSSMRELAVGTGLVYYHRDGHALEPPNLFAPYWRAGLTRFTVDRPRAGQRGVWDQSTVDFLDQAGSTEAAEAFQALDNAGYGGFQ